MSSCPRAETGSDFVPASPHAVAHSLSRRYLRGYPAAAARALPRALLLYPPSAERNSASVRRAQNLDSLATLATDVEFTCAAAAMSASLARRGTPSWRYVFTYNASFQRPVSLAIVCVLKQKQIPRATPRSHCRAPLRLPLPPSHCNATTADRTACLTRHVRSRRPCDLSWGPAYGVPHTAELPFFWGQPIYSFGQPDVLCELTARPAQTPFEPGGNPGTKKSMHMSVASTSLAQTCT